MSQAHPSPADRAARNTVAAADPSAVVSENLDALITTAARAPSVHNSQPWRFRATADAVELHADLERRLHFIDPDGREQLISCGAALFGLRLAVRELGYRPLVQLLPDPQRPEFLARVRLGSAMPMRSGERMLLTGLRRRHTHRGPFTGEPLPEFLPAVLQRDAEAEAATLVMVDGPGRFGPLAGLAATAAHRERRHPTGTGQVLAWTRPPGSQERDGVPSRAYPTGAARSPGGLAQRDFDLGRAWGSLRIGETADPTLVTAVLVTAGDAPADWLRAGQALHRLLLRAAGQWVFASLHSQPLEASPIRAAWKMPLRCQRLSATSMSAS